MLSTLKYPDSEKLNINRYAKILSVGVHLPEKRVTNQDIIDKYDLIATDRAVQHSIGIKERRFAGEDESVSDLLYQVAKECLEKADVDPSKLDRIIYTKLLGDRIAPATSIKVLEKLNVENGIPAFDISAACSGFVHLIDMAIRYIDSGDNYVLILGGDISSRLYNAKNKKDTRTIFLNGDAVVGMLLGPSEKKHFFASYLYTDNTYFEYSYIPFGSELLNNSRAFNDEIFNMQMPDGMIVHNSVIDSAEIVSSKLLEQTDFNLDEIDIFVTCDQTTFTWKAQLDRLNIPVSKSCSSFDTCGNTVAAMSLINLNRLVEEGRLKRGMKVMFMAHGAGASGGGLIFEY
jgi:3-oxoacyl-[acyl-carrier-protein] synthase-3